MFNMPLSNSRERVTPTPREAAVDSSGDEQNSAMIMEDQEESVAFKPGSGFYLAFGSLCVIILAAALDATSLSVALPIIAKEINGSAIEAFWAGTSFLLASTVFQPTFASLSHIFGRKILILSSVVFFAAGSLIAALAGNFAVLLAGRTVQGIGGGGIISLTEVLITDLVPLRDRGTWFALQSLTWAVGAVVGPLMGGSLSEHASWRWIFWINIPICAVGFVVLVLFLRLHRRAPQSLRTKILEFDWVGAILMTGSVTSFLIPVSWGGVMYPWNAWQTLLPLILGAVGMIGFVVYERYGPKQPLVPLDIFYQRTGLVNYFGTFIQGVVLWCMVYYLPFYYEAVKDYSPTFVGVAVFPQTFTIAPTTIVVGIVISKTGRFRWAIWTGWFLTVLGMGLLCLLDVSTAVPAWIFLNLVPSFGLGCLYTSLGCATQAAATERTAAFAAAMYTFLRSFGQAVGVAVGGVIFQSQFQLNLSAYPFLAGNASQLAQDASSLVQVIKDMDHGAPERQMIVQAYADALKIVWVTMAGIAFTALVASGWSEGLDLNRKQETEQGLKTKSKIKAQREA